MEPLSRILHVEDEDDIRTVVGVTLHAIGGFTVLQCASGQEAVEKGPAFAPQLILLDVMMPRLDGPSTLRALRATPELTATPVIFMTAKVQRQEMAALMDLGALDVIAKPFDPMTLPRQIKRIWEEKAGK